LVTQRGVGESASAVWKAVQEQHARIQVRTSGTDEDNGASIGDPESASDVDPAISIPSARPTLIFGASPSTAPARRRPKPDGESQLALFCPAVPTGNSETRLIQPGRRPPSLHGGGRAG